ncbi:MAG: endonuclease III [Dehalococcoidales bacterium]
MDIGRIIDTLKIQYGIPPGPPRQNTPVSVLVQTILSQNTSDTNSSRAFRSLLDYFESLESVADAETSAIARCIRSGGLGAIKAERIKEVLREIKRRRGEIELDFLSKLHLEDAENWLISLPGVGVKTARCVLLFSFGMPALPVDTHILRVSRRLGLTRGNASAKDAHQQLPEMVKPDDIMDFHLLVIEHGRRICTALHPRCQECPLANICISSSFSRK